MGKKTIMYCALGDYGIEFASKNETECKEWVAEQIAESRDGHFGAIPMDDDYYQIVTHTQAELDAMPEV